MTGTNLTNRPVMSLHVGGEIARTSTPIIDPDDLRIVGFHLAGGRAGKDIGSILETRDIRENSDIGFIVDSDDVFVTPEDAIRLADVLKINFELVGKKVVTKKGTKIGRVTNYTVDPEDFMVRQVEVQRPIMKAFMDPELLIGRSEIVSVDDKKITVRDEESKLKESAAQDFTPNFVNPFRKNEALSLEEGSTTTTEDQ